MMYSLLIYEMPGLPDARAPEERQLALAAHRGLQRDAKQSGAYVGASQLSESGAMTVRRRKGQPLVTDGPFAETKELFIGFYLVDCATLDEALELAQRIPVSDVGCVEVRPVTWSESTNRSPA